MANVQNLKPCLTKEEARERGRRGGIASGKARREAKSVKYYIDTLLSLPLKNEQIKERLKEAGLDPDDMDNKMAMVYMQWIECAKGNTKAFENLLNYAGEKPVEQVQNINPPQIVIERPEK